MKQTFKFMTVMIITFFSLSTFSCSKDQLSPNDNTETTGTTTQTGGIIVGTGPIMLTPLLTKHGPVTLTYKPSRELATVNYTPLDKTVYSLINQNGKITHLLQQYYNGTEIYRYKYVLNSSGLAEGIKCEKKDSNGDWDLYWETTYEYNASKQLIHQIDGTAHEDLSYDANGNITSSKYFNWKNQLVYETTFWYTINGSALINNKNNINPDVASVDRYLKIYGKFMKHLPRRIKYSNYLPDGDKTDFTYEYVLDANGFIKTEKKSYTGFNVLAETKACEYQ